LSEVIYLLDQRERGAAGCWASREQGASEEESEAVETYIIRLGILLNASQALAQSLPSGYDEEPPTFKRKSLIGIGGKVFHFKRRESIIAELSKSKFITRRGCLHLDQRERKRKKAKRLSFSWQWHKVQGLTPTDKLNLA
jgi:hypothetical protein